MAILQYLKQCRDLVLRPEQRVAYLRDLCSRGGLIAGIISNYIPVEIVAAAGLSPVRIIGRFAASDYHGRSLYTPVCGFARDAFAAAESGVFDDFACVIFPHSCDSLRVLQQMWPASPKVFGLTHPVAADDSAIDYFADQLRNFAETLKKQVGQHFSEVGLVEEIQRYNQTRRLLRQLYAMNDHLTGSDRIAIVTAAMIMDRDHYNTMLQQVIDEQVSRGPVKPAGKRILVLGPLVDNLQLLDAVEQRDAVIVDDDITNGRRYFDLDVEREGDLYYNLSKRYLRAVPSPTLSTNTEQDQQAFRLKLEEVKPDGVLYINQKFCEPHIHNYFSKLDILREMNINILMLEVEHSSPEVSERDLLRIESFIETIGEA